ncbi:UNVERIFIED_CONTAM: hypothetical protein Slati_0515500 [Sesamum latifolium]|uniref:ATP-dependent DNA helicase n=1 Tax=Sesamum latifolium TaxID=2727402 RepID=A0AAW2XYN1_9LAMI
MTSEQRELYLARRCASYHRRRMQSENASNSIPVVNSCTPESNINASPSTDRRAQQREQRRIVASKRRRAMTSEQRTAYLAQRRTSYHHRRAQVATCTNNNVPTNEHQNVNHNQGDDCYTMPHAFHDAAISFNECGDTHRGPHENVNLDQGQRSDLPQCRLIIKQQAPNRHQYALPTASQVAAIIVDGEGIENLNNRDIMIEAMDGRLLNIQDGVGYYDPLQYPLLLPHDEHNSKTMLTEFFKINCDPALAGKYLYVEFPQHFRWIQSQKTWIARTSQNKGPRSFEELLTINGVTYTTFKEAAQRRGLLQEDDYVRQCLHEARSVRMPASLRRLFVSILIFCQSAGVRQLWDEFYPYMIEDYAISSSADTSVHINRLLLEIRRLLYCYRRQLSEFDLPPISEDSDSSLSRIIQDELSVHIPAEDLQSIDKLNDNQKCAFDAIKRTISHNQSEIFFIDGPGGSGKTFLYRAILVHLRVNGHIVIATATSGIAATLLPGGRTTHSRFKIPLKPTADSFCKIDKQSDLAN